MGERHVWVPAFDGPRCWGCECSPRSRAAAGPCGCPRLAPQAIGGETGEDECGMPPDTSTDEDGDALFWSGSNLVGTAPTCPDPTTRARR